MKKDLIIFFSIIILAVIYFTLRDKQVPVEELVTQENQTKKSSSALKYKFSRPQVSESISFITGELEPEVHYVTRNKLILKMDPQADYTQEDIRGLIDFISQPAPGEGPQLAYHSLKNDTMSFLIETGQYRPELTEKLVNTMLDSQTHQVWSEYISQYLPDLFEKLENDNDPKLQDQIVQALIQATEQQVGALAGSALMGLQQLQGKHPLASQDRIIQIANDIIQDSFIESASQMGAVQVLTDSLLSSNNPQLIEQNLESTELIQQIALDDSQSVSLRMAAINSAYRLQRKDPQWLNDFQQNFDPEQSDKRLLMVINNLIKQ